jgi:hypothetical protein
MGQILPSLPWQCLISRTTSAVPSAYLLLVVAINRVSPICRSVHAWVVRWGQSISITIIKLPSSIVCPTPLVAKICSRLPNPKKNQLRKINWQEIRIYEQIMWKRWIVFAGPCKRLLQLWRFPVLNHNSMEPPLNKMTIYFLKEKMEIVLFRIHMKNNSIKTD